MNDQNFSVSTEPGDQIGMTIIVSKSKIQTEVSVSIFEGYTFQISAATRKNGWYGHVSDVYCSILGKYTFSNVYYISSAVCVQIIVN